MTSFDPTQHGGRTEYAETVSGRCYRCKSKFVRVSAPSPNRGKFAFVRGKDEIGRDICLHVGCSEKWNPIGKTADVDHYAEAAGTARKPAHE